MIFMTNTAEVTKEQMTEVRDFLYKMRAINDEYMATIEELRIAEMYTDFIYSPSLEEKTGTPNPDKRSKQITAQMLKTDFKKKKANILSKYVSKFFESTELLNADDRKTVEDFIFYDYDPHDRTHYRYMNKACINFAPTYYECGLYKIKNLGEILKEELTLKA